MEIRADRNWSSRSASTTTTIRFETLHRGIAVKTLRLGIWLGSISFAVISMPALAQDSPEAVVKKRFEATAQRDIDAIAALYAPDALETSPAFCNARRGSAGARKTYGDLFRDAPGIEDEVTNFVVDGNHVAVQFIARVRKPDGSIAFEVPLANFLTVEHGRIVRDDTYFDTKGRACS
jgi:ketosteroid isomerase-like protein